MFQEIFISPVLFIESLIGCLLLPKMTVINPVYGNAASGGVLTGLATIGIIPQIDSFIGQIMILVTIFVLFCVQNVVDVHNSRKTISLWTNCLGMSCYGLVSGLAMSLTDGYEFIKYATSLIISTLAISYAMGFRYIEYVSRSNDRLPLIVYSMSTPVGLLIGRFSGLSHIKSDMLLGVSAGTFLTFGIHSMLSHTKPVSALYLEEDNKKKIKNILLCFSVLCGFVVSCLLQSRIFTNIVDSISNDNDNSTLAGSNATLELSDFNATIGDNSTLVGFNTTLVDNSTAI
jgi:fumarate reductase subunit D